MNIYINKKGIFYFLVVYIMNNDIQIINDVCIDILIVNNVFYDISNVENSGDMKLVIIGL